MRIFVLLALLLSLCRSAPVQAVDSRSIPPGPYAGLPAAPLTSRPVVPQPPAVYVPLPPRLPAFLPSGGANLDEAWIQDGGARLYWNTLVIPRQLRMGGARFVDPASVPELLPPGSVKVVQPVPRRRAAARPKASQSAKTVSAPAHAGSTALTLPTAKLPAAAGKPTEASSERGKPDTLKNASAPASTAAGTAAPYTGTAPATAPPTPLPIMPADLLPPRAPAASR